MHSQFMDKPEKKTCPVCYCLFPATRRRYPGEDPDCCSSKCNYVKEQSKRHNKVLFGKK